MAIIIGIKNKGNKFSFFDRLDGDKLLFETESETNSPLASRFDPWNLT